jgi:diguanylate cyclase (GGDEF)-like protein
MQENPVILAVDDTETNIDILVELLGDKYEVMVALDGESALEITEEEKIDLILLDIMMPEMDGFEVCNRLKSNEKTKNIPIIFLTAKTDEDSIEKAYEVGGIDYVTKPFRPKELLARVNRELAMQKLIKDLKNSQDELRKLAATDPMTKLYNRRYFSQISAEFLELAKRNNQELSVIMLDIDKFKRINDTYGHKVGDDVIIALSKILVELKRKSDIACRFGGEEFVLLLPNTAIDGAEILAQKIRETVQNRSVKVEDDKELNFTISLGVSLVNVQNETNIEVSLKKADDALYKAKESGRNKVCVNI